MGTKHKGKRSYKFGGGKYLATAVLAQHICIGFRRELRLACAEQPVEAATDGQRRGPLGLKRRVEMACGGLVII